MKWWLIVVVLIAGCGSNPPTFSEDAFLGTWVTEFDGEDGTKVRIIWTFESLFDGDRTVWNEIHRDNAFIRHRKVNGKYLTRRDCELSWTAKT